MENEKAQDGRGMKRVHLIVSGDVQGVGFRTWVHRLAQDLHLTGWVKNRNDGTVEIVAEGEQTDLEELMKRCRRGPNQSWVKSVDSEWSQTSGTWGGFEVLY